MQGGRALKPMAHEAWAGCWCAGWCSQGVCVRMPQASRMRDGGGRSKAGAPDVRKRLGAWVPIDKAPRAEGGSPWSPWSCYCVPTRQIPNFNSVVQVGGRSALRLVCPPEPRPHGAQGQQGWVAGPA